MRRFDRAKAKDELLRRTQESSERREGGDASLKYFKPDLNLPIWQARITKDEPHIIDIIPFIAGKNYPTKVDKRHPIKEGDYAYWLEVYVHTNIGPGKDWVVCPTRNYGLPCPICEEIDQRIRDGQEWENYKDISPKRRCVYNIVCYDDGKEEAKGVQIWEVSYKYGEGPIQLAAKNPRGGGAIPYSDVDVGKSISFEVANDEYRTIQGHKLLDRDYIISDATLDQSFTLDEVIVIPTYDQIEKLFLGKISEKKEEEKKSEDDVPDMTPPRGSSRRPHRTEEGTPPSNTASNNPCPSNGKFGIDIDQLINCGNCKKYDSCADEAERIEAEKKANKSSMRRRG